MRIIGLFGMNFSLKLDLWEKNADTPFWLAISSIEGKQWTITERLTKSINSISIKYNLTFVEDSNYDGYFLSIRPTLFKTEDVVIRNLTEKIHNIIEELNSYN